MNLKEKRIGVLWGGLSREREVSFRSGKNISEALTRLGYNVVMVDPAESMDFSVFDVAYIALHGFFGEDGCVQSLLERAGKPYTGSGVATSVLGMNKLASKQLFATRDSNCTISFLFRASFGSSGRVYLPSGCKTCFRGV